MEIKIWLVLVTLTNLEMAITITD